MSKIAYILKMYPRFSETFIVNEILELERRGVHVRIYSVRKPDDGRFHASLARVKARVVYVPRYPAMEREQVLAAHRELKLAHPQRYRSLHEQVEVLGTPEAIKRFLQAGVIANHLLHNPVDAMHAHFASSGARVAHWASLLTGVPYSFTAHAKDIYHQEVNPDSLRDKITDARFVVTVSDFNQQYLRSLMGDESSDIRRLYNGIDLTRFRPDPSVAREQKLILAVGRLVEKKGFDNLIQACALLADRGLGFRCEIIGKGPLKQALSDHITKLGVGEFVKLIGARPQDQVLQAYKRATIFALPCIVGSDGNRDGLPTVLLEAMATGLPPVSTDLTGIPEIIDHNVNGLVVPPGDVAALANGLARLLHNPALRKRLGTAARRKVEREFDVRQNVAQLQRWLAEPTPPAPAEYVSLSPEAEPITVMSMPPVPDIEEVFQSL